MSDSGTKRTDAGMKSVKSEERTMVLLHSQEYFYKQSPFIHFLDYLRVTLARRAWNVNYKKYLRREAKGQT